MIKPEIPELLSDEVFDVSTPEGIAEYLTRVIDGAYPGKYLRFAGYWIIQDGMTEKCRSIEVYTNEQMEKWAKDVAEACKAESDPETEADVFVEFHQPEPVAEC